MTLIKENIFFFMFSEKGCKRENEEKGFLPIIIFLWRFDYQKPLLDKRKGDAIGEITRKQIQNKA